MHPNYFEHISSEFVKLKEDGSQSVLCMLGANPGVQPSSRNILGVGTGQKPLAHYVAGMAEDSGENDGLPVQTAHESHIITGSAAAMAELLRESGAELPEQSRHLTGLLNLCQLFPV